MTDISEFGALNWVKDELDESVRKARRALETFVEAGHENAELDRCAEYLHQIAGVLQIVQIYGPGMLAEEMEAVARAMLDGHVRQMQDAAEALMLALIQLPDYLEKLQGGDADIPLIILPLLNDLRAVRDAPLLSEAALFHPDTKEASIGSHLSDEPNPELPKALQVLRQKFHLGLLGWLRQQQVETSWRQLVGVFDELEEYAGTRQFYRLVWVCGALMRGLINGSIASGMAIKQVFSKVDRQLKLIIDQGETALESEQVDDLLKNLLYYIAQAETDEQKIVAVKQAFALDELLPSEAELAQGRQGLSGSNAELAASISDAVQKELTRVKDVLDLFMRQQDADLDMLEHLEKPMRQLADTLGMIGQGALRTRLLRQANKVKEFLEKGTPPEEYELMEMAGDILFVESSLSTLQTIQPREFVESPDKEAWGSGLSDSEYQKLIKQTVHEAKLDIAKAKEAIIGYTESPSEPEYLRQVLKGFRHVYGALKVLNLSESAQILADTTAFIQNCLSNDQPLVDRQQLNALADVISSIEYYLEALVDGAGNRREIIAIAQSALNCLLQSRTIPGESLVSEEHASSVGVEPSEALEDETTSDSAETSREQAVQEVLESREAESEIPVRAEDKPPLEDIDAEILEIFVEEAKEELETIAHDLPAWLKNNDNKDSLISFRRSFHTLKGSGRLVGAKTIGELAWSVENMLNRVIEETIQPSVEMQELLEEVLEILPVLIDCQERNVYPEVDVDGVMQRAFAITEGRIPDARVTQEPGDQAPLHTEHENADTAVDASSDLDLSDDTLEADTSLELPEATYSEPESDLSGLSLDSDSEPKELINERGFSDSDLTIEVDTELLNVFAEETEGHLAEVDRFIELARSAQPPPPISDDIIRAFHTLDGSARMTGITPIANLSKSVEEYLKILAAKGRQADGKVLDLLTGSMAYVRQFLLWTPADDAPEPDADSYLLLLRDAKAELLGEDRLATESAPLEIMDADTEEPSELPEPAEAASDVDLPGSLQNEKIFTLDEDPELVEIFQEEAKELLEGLDANFDGWLQAPETGHRLETIQRGLHTLKGSARLAGIMPVGDLAQALEKFFRAVDDDSAQAVEPYLDQIRRSLAILAAQVDEIDTLGRVHWADAQVDTLETCLVELNKAASDKSATEGVQAVEMDDTGDAVSEDLDLLEAAEEEDIEFADTEQDFSEFYAEPVSTLVDPDLFKVAGDEELLEVFLEEARDLLNELEESYQGLDAQLAIDQQIHGIQRVLHTLKGSARLAGVLPVGDLSHALETYFNALAEGRTAVSDDGMQVVRQALDMLAVQVDEAESIGQVHNPDALLEQLESLMEPVEADTDFPPPDSLTAKGEAAMKPLTGLETIQSVNLLEQVDGLLDNYVEVGEDQELVEVFCDEAKEILEQLESAYQHWNQNRDDLSLIGDIQRSLHTLKGSARLAGIAPIGDLSHGVESLLTWVADEAKSADDAIVNLTRQAIDRLASQVDDTARIGKVAIADDMLKALDDVMRRDADSAVLAAKSPASDKVPESKQSATELQTESAVVLPFVSEIAKRVEARKSSDRQTPFKTSKDQVRISAELMDRLVNYAGEVSIYRARLEQQNSVLGFNIAELEQTVSRLHNQLRNLEIETETQILYRWERDSDKDDREKADFDPLELDRFSNMQQLSRALVETVNDLGNIKEAISDLQRQTDTLLLQQSRISTDLQDGLLRTRMVPFSQLMPRMQRLVRQTANQMGKQAQLEGFGIEGELDRNILNRMVPVLEHLLRNAVSHGIETPVERQARGKPEIGRISLDIDREATNVLLTLADDGRGLDTEAIRSKAIKLGMLDKDAEVMDDDLIQCVLNPGFSTAKEITQIAGRGVGLDVVASEVKQLGGSLDIDSQPGSGTSFTIRLPLTLAITDALLVRVGEEIYAVPHGSVEGVVRIRRQELQACYSGHQEHYRYANRKYKTIYLGRMMGLEHSEISESGKWFPLMLVHAGEHHVAMQVDELLGTRQIVVKSIGKQAGSVRWITGGTILADGRVALILDVGALVRMDAARLPSAVARETVSRQPTKERVRVMVVDDSITVRKVTGRLLERHDMEVLTAKDGVEAVALLQEQVPDIMLLDIEMPRMDGFELARHINNSVDYYGLPIIMITSRVGEKHRQRAFDLGVKRCLGKPYQEAELLENINQVLAEVKS